VDVFRTPDERFQNLPEFPWAPKYHDWEGLRLAYIDEGEGQPIVFFHGEPSWSFLYRTIIAVLLDKGYRCVAPDLIGFGRSDKPTDVGWYSFDRHTESILSLIESLDLSDAVFVVHDWGGSIGLRIGTLEAPERVSRFIAMDTGLFTGRQRMSETWHAFRDFIARTEDVPVSLLVERACATELAPEVVAAYDAPFPTPESKAGVRSFLLMWGDSDVALPLDPVGRKVQSLFPTAEELTVIHDGGHFLQEDQGHEIGALIADWLVHT
jgi:haloalkane dehalogenase